jgi:hypothetical protein
MVPKNKTLQLRIDSMTGVNPKRTHGIGIWGNERVVMSIRVDKKLKKAFTEASKALFGSTCNPIESWMAGVVGIYSNQKMSGVNPSITVDIGEIKIERNLRERRKLTKTVTIEQETETAGTPLKCGFVCCKKEPVGKGLFLPKNETMLLCADHIVHARSNRHLWKLLS